MKPLGRITTIVGLDELIIWSLDQLPVHVDDVHKMLYADVRHRRNGGYVPYAWTFDIDHLSLDDPVL